MAIILFLGQLISAVLTWRFAMATDCQNTGEPFAISSVITGFGFSCFLFMSWLCINSVYGASENGIKRFHIQTTEEMKTKMPKVWLTTFAIIYLLVGFSITICQTIILRNSDYSDKWWLSELSGARFAYGAVLILTGIFCIILMTFPKKRTSNFFCFIFAIGSLVLAALGSSEAVMEYYNRHNFEPHNPQEFLGHQSRLDMTSEGKPYFLGWWTLETLVFQTYNFLIVAISLALIFICINLLFSIRIIPKSTKCETAQRREKCILFLVGMVQIVLGLIINKASVLAAKIIAPTDFTTPYYEDFENYVTRPAGCLTLFITGLLSLSIARSYTETKRIVLFLFSFLTMAGIILVLIGSTQTYNEVIRIGNVAPVTQNSTDFCITDKNYERICIPIEKRCDGILDLFNNPHINGPLDQYKWSDGPSYSFAQRSKLADELYCPELYNPVYISIFSAAGIAIILTLVIWYMTFDSFGFFARLFWKGIVDIKQNSFSHVPLTSAGFLSQNTTGAIFNPCLGKQEVKDEKEENSKIDMNYI